jgi:hypothetical protein
MRETFGERKRDSFGIVYTNYLLSIVKIKREVKREKRERERKEKGRERESKK